MWKSKSIAFVIWPGWKLSSTAYEECEIKVVCQVIWFVSFLNSQLGWIYLLEMIKNFLYLKTIKSSMYLQHRLNDLVSLLWPLLIICLESRSHTSKGKSQKVMEHSWFPLEFQLPDRKTPSKLYKMWSPPPFISSVKYPWPLVTLICVYLTLPSFFLKALCTRLLILDFNKSCGIEV